MKNYMVAHFRKIKTGAGLSAVAHHNQRLDIYDRAGKQVGKLPDYISHPERARLNTLDRVEAEGVHARRKDRIEQANLTRKPNKNAAAAIEAVYSASPEWFDKRSEKEWKNYFHSLRDWTEKKFGKDNILHIAEHYDEKTPHMHVILAPIVESKEKGNRYTSGHFLGGRDGLRKIQDELVNEVGYAYSLERGEPGSMARHTNQFEWIKEVDQKSATLDYERQALRDAYMKDVEDFDIEGLRKKEIPEEADRHAKRHQIIAKSAKDQVKKLEGKVAGMERDIARVRAQENRIKELMKENKELSDDYDYLLESFKKNTEIMAFGSESRLQQARENSREVLKKHFGIEKPQSLKGDELAPEFQPKPKEKGKSIESDDFGIGY